MTSAPRSADLADDGDDVLGAQICSRLGVAFGAQVFVEHDLRNAAAVAQVEKDQVAVIAAAVYPAHQYDRLPASCGAQYAAGVCALQFPRKSSKYSYLFF